MRCEEVQAQASAWLDKALPETEARMVSAHEKGCAACRAYVADLRHLSEGLSLLGREPASERLRERITVMLAQKDAPRSRAATWRGWGAPWLGRVASLAVVCALSVFGTWAVMDQRAGAEMARHDVVAAHMRAMLQDSPIQIASGDRHTVRPWFNGRVEFAPPVKDLSAEGFRLIGGRLDFIDGRRVATLVYHRRLHTVSVFVWPETAAAAAWRPSGAAGLNLLSWNKDGMVWWAVSDLNPEELRELRALL